MELYQAILKEYPDILTVNEMSAALGVNPKTGYKLIKENKIQSLKIGNTYRIAKINVLAFLKVNLIHT